MSMILIDWWSPEPHVEFNRNFYLLLGSVSKLYVYNDKLAGLGTKSIIKKSHKSRIIRAMSVYKICWKNRGSKLFFISYDDIFLPFVQLFVKTIFCYEHNTTPDSAFGNKHAVWQKLTFLKIIRFCQSFSQLRILKEMRQKSEWLGLPISETINLDFIDTDPTFILVSEQFSISDAKNLMPMLYGKVIAKKNTAKIEALVFPDDVQVDLVKRISIPFDFLKAEALVVALESPVRGTGWYNEALTYGIPVIITSAGQQQVFEATYPNYPYIKGNTLKSREDLKKRLNQVKTFDNKKYVKNYMDDMKIRANFFFQN